MADEIVIEELTRQLRDLIPVLRDLGKTNATGSSGSAASDRVVVAIGKLASALDKNTKSKKQQTKELDDFLKSVDKTIEAQEELRKKQEENAKKIKDAADAQAEAQRRAGLTAAQLAEEERKRKEALAKEENKQAYDSFRRDTNYATALAKEQLAQAASSASLRGSLEKLGGQNVSYQKALIVASEVLGQLGTGALGFAKGMAEGNTKFTALNPLIDGMAGAISKMVEGIPILGGILSGATKMVAEGSKFMLQQLQTATDSFQQLSNVGALTSEGMSGVQKQFLQSGMSLDGFRKAITNNSQALAKFGGTVGRGAEEFTKITGVILDKELGDPLRRLGYTADSFGETTAGFIAMQARLGLTQGKSVKEMSVAAADYAKQLDGLARVTGQSREAAQKQIDAALSESRFRAVIEEMNANSQQDAAKELKFFQNRIASVNASLGESLRSAASNQIDNELAAAYTAAGIDLVGLMDRVKNRELDSTTATKELQRQILLNKDRLIELNKTLPVGNRILGDFAGLMDIANSTILENGDIVLKDQDVKDKLTNETVSAQKSMEQMSRQIQNFGFSIMPKAAAAVESFTSSLNKFIKGVARATGINLPTITGEADSGSAATAGFRENKFARRRRRYQEGTAPVTPTTTTPAGSTAPAAPGTPPSGPEPGSREAALEQMRQQYGKKPSAAPAAAPTTGAGAGRAEPTLGSTGTVPGKSVAADPKKILDFIAKYESNGQYDIMVGGQTIPSLTSMSVSEVLDFQRRFGGSGAAGRYQIIPRTLEGLVAQRVVDPSDKFDQSTQDKLGIALLERRGYSAFKSGRITAEQFANNLAKEWAALPTSSGQSYYAGVGNNKSAKGMVQADVISAITAQAAFGGVFAGPKSGYPAILHGTEAVIPMSADRKMPVDVTGIMDSMNRAFEPQMQAMQAQISRLDELVSLMRRQANTGERMLQLKQA